MKLEDLNKQSEQMEAFQAGYKACLQWVAQVLANEAKEKLSDSIKEDK